jgi:hypothetical protein
MPSTMKKSQFNADELASELNEWGIDLKKLRARAGKASGDAKIRLEGKTAELQKRLDEGRDKLEALRKAGKAATAELKKGAEAARGRLEKAFENAKAEFEQLGSQSK